jgi:catechol 2,3-dioxygenase-like lactoylglutathione lyase family enzyme
MITRMENVGIVVEDLPAAIDFFARLGLELEGEATVDQDWAARIGGFDEVRLDVAMMRTPDGNGPSRSKFLRSEAIQKGET